MLRRAAQQSTVECPYCAEIIKDKATVCRYCQRELHLILPLTARVAELEAEVGRLQNQLVPAPPEQTRTLWQKIGVPTLVGCTAAIVPPLLSYELDWGRLAVIMVFAIPLATGAWAGLRSTRPRWRPLILGGAIVAAAVFIGGLLASVIADHQSLWIVASLDWKYVALASATVFFTWLTGAMLGAWIARRRGPQERSLGADIAHSISNSITPGQAPTVTIQMVGTVLASLSPLLVLFGTVFTAYMSYLANKHGVPAPK